MNLKLLIKKIFYFGFKFYCVYCKSNLRKLKPHGLTHIVLERLNVVGGKRSNNNKCPICNSTQRERLLYFYYTEILTPEIEKNVTETKLLHIAPEKNFSLLLQTNSNIKYYSGDKFESGYENSYEAPFVDICHTNFQDNFFDVIICNHVLEHVDSYQQALTEIKRILKKGGRALLQVPIANLLQHTYEDINVIDEKSREEKFGQRDHVRLFGKDYPNVLEESGFTVNQYSAKNISKENTYRYALDKDEILFEVIK